MVSSTLFLFDDDCGVCTKSARFFRRILNGRMKFLPMHHPHVMKRGVAAIGDDEYWRSFHIVKDDVWMTEKVAIAGLADHFPLGRLIGTFVRTPPVMSVLFALLRVFQRTRTAECMAKL